MTASRRDSFIHTDRKAHMREGRVERHLSKGPRTCWQHIDTLQSDFITQIALCWGKETAPVSSESLSANRTPVIHHSPESCSHHQESYVLLWLHWLLYHKDHRSHGSAGTGQSQARQYPCGAWIIKSVWQVYSGHFPCDVRRCLSAALCTCTFGQACVYSIEFSDIDLKWSLFQEHFYKEELKDDAYWPASQLVAWWRCLTKCQWAPSLPTVLRDIGSDIDSEYSHSTIS